MNNATFELGSDNVYEDLGFIGEEAKDLLVKAQLVAAIKGMLESLPWTQELAAKNIGLTHPRLSRLLRGDFRGVSEAKLLECIMRMGCDIKIVIGKRSENMPAGHLEVVQQG